MRVQERKAVVSASARSPPFTMCPCILARVAAFQAVCNCSQHIAITAITAIATVVALRCRPGAQGVLHNNLFLFIFISFYFYRHRAVRRRRRRRLPRLLLFFFFRTNKLTLDE